MRLTRRRFACVAVAGWLAAPLGAQEIEVGGDYLAQGMNPNGSRYEGEVTITQDAGRITMEWAVGRGNYAGEGIIEGRVVVVDWGQQSPVIYVVTPGRALHGTWADGTAVEKLTPK